MKKEKFIKRFIMIFFVLMFLFLLFFIAKKESLTLENKETIQKEIQIEKSNPKLISLEKKGKDYIRNKSFVTTEKETKEETTVKETQNETNKKEYTFTQLNQTMYAKNSVNVRTGPSVDFSVLQTLTYGESVTVNGQCNETGWYQINLNEGIGYVSNKYLTTEKIEYNGICEINGNVDTYWSSVVNQTLSILPNGIIQAFKDSGWHIYVTDMNIDATYYNSQFGAVMATTNYGEYRILVEDRNDAVIESPVHEFGHWFDWYNGYTTNSSEFDNIYNTETSAFKNAFLVNFYYDKMELFAEGFAKYFEDPNTLANNCPQLYNYLNNLLSSYI